MNYIYSYCLLFSTLKFFAGVAFFQPNLNQLRVTISIGDSVETVMWINNMAEW